MHWKGCGRKRSLPRSGYYPQHRADQIGENHEKSGSKVGGVSRLEHRTCRNRNASTGRPVATYKVLFSSKLFACLTADVPLTNVQLHVAKRRRRIRGTTAVT
jgi:hypothetical protein